MNNLPGIYFTLENCLFPIVKEEFCKITEKMKELLRIIEAVRPAGFITPAMLIFRKDVIGEENATAKVKTLTGADTSFIWKLGTEKCRSLQF